MYNIYTLNTWKKYIYCIHLTIFLFITRLTFFKLAISLLTFQIQYLFNALKTFRIISIRLGYFLTIINDFQQKLFNHKAITIVYFNQNLFLVFQAGHSLNLNQAILKRKHHPTGQWCIPSNSINLIIQIEKPSNGHYSTKLDLFVSTYW